ncbi:hypothetical protein HGI30_04280 [Paenibacillus albicereus]|uniref:Uncharacterized protein n=2 Tax=Paenibacillus albicereus TaxID=2726185 RepID=A0A6H2H3J5_9BACL|nr:hypothetical protein HGI30_04280 [Paenibacillus albicereus]
MIPLPRTPGHVTVIIEKDRRRIVAKAPLGGIDRIVCVINRQYTNAPNTTQIASGAGRSSASGSNAAIDSPWTRQQESVGAGGTARNVGLKGGRGGSSRPLLRVPGGKELVIVINDQVVKLAKGTPSSSATQIASGAGRSSTGGTNSAIGSPGTWQQDAVGGGGKAVNRPGKPKPGWPKRRRIR